METIVLVDEVTEQQKNTLETIIMDIKEIINRHEKNGEECRKKVESIVSLLDDLKKDENILVGIVNETSTKEKYTNILYIAIENYVPLLGPFFESLIERFPKLISLPRKDEEYKGHTAFHLAVCKNNLELAKKMLDKVGRADKEELFREFATGSNFEETVMLGELPLFTAALSFNKEMFEFLLNEGADLYETNSTKDDIYHALIRYADYYPNKEDEVIEFLRLVMTKDETTRKETEAVVGENAETTNDSLKGSKSTDTTKLGNNPAKDTSNELKHADQTKQEYTNKEPSKVPMSEDKSKQNKYPTKDTSKEMKPADTTKQEESTKETSKKLKPGSLWSWKNDSGLNPLELATKFGLCKTFEMIYNSEPYFIEQGNDGLNDIKTYDITDLDPVVPKDVCYPSADSGFILQFLFQIHPSQAFPFIRTPQVSKIIEEKWKCYRWIVYIWFIFHLVFMSFLTCYAIERSKQNPNDGKNFSVVASPLFRKKVFSNNYVTVFAFITLVWGVLYLSPEIGKRIKFGIPCKRKGIRSKTNEKGILQTIKKWGKKIIPNPYSNASYRVLMALFSISLILDCCFALGVGINSDFKYEQYCLYISVIIGWLFVIFFLRISKYFSFFGVLLQKVIFGDVLRFILVFLLVILGFGTAMFMAIQGSPVTDKKEYCTFGRTLISLITLIAGIGDPPDFYDTRHPGICIAIFIMYIVMITIIILNALIAMMGTTCSELVGNVENKHTHDRYWKLERLSVILFLESIIPEQRIKRVGKEVITGREKRRHLEIRSLKKLDSNEIVDKRANTHTTKELPRQKEHKNAKMDIYHINQCEHYKPYEFTRSTCICPQDSTNNY
ncbi:TRPV3-like protein [Mya arenaria]|uniref:TRPV3-like protein n=1 Tax=Mya arenaria TaxID=6604 RepID=A0ABY7EEE0_MYAAR|nr:uncharacterized protein LOC128233387 [Mya arenaria]WAR05531.1 TRPV3-like protein [Mya arenaria]